MKLFKRALACVMVFFLLISVTACSVDEEQYGEFSSGGHYLTKYSKEEITADQAKKLISDNAAAITQNLGEAIPGIREDDLPLPSQELVSYFMATYSDCTAMTTYYIDDGEEVVKQDFLQGTDFKAMIEDNVFVPFNQLVAKLVVIFPEVIDYMEKQNQKFTALDTYDVAPFKTLFSYHTDENGNLVIQCRDFAEIPSSEAGGVACSYRQDTEIVFDSSNKLSDWQTSLGVYTASPQETIKKGYIMKVKLEWSIKK